MEIIRLDNGIEVVLKPMKGYTSVTTGVWVRTGSRYEEEEESGSAHFLEHLLFKGTGQRTCEELKRLIEGVGGTFNAFTTEETTCYYIKMPFSKHLTLSLDVLSDMVKNPSLPPEEIERERNVILEEIKMYQDVPAAYVQELFSNLVFPQHPLGRFIAGTLQTVKSLSREHLFDYWHRFYRGKSLVVSIAGDFDPEEAKEKVTLFLKDTVEGEPLGFTPVKEKESGPDFLFHPKETEQIHFCLGGRGVAREDERRWAVSLLATIMGGNMSSRLFVEVREKRGLAYQISMSAASFADTGIFAIDAGTSTSTLKEALRVIREEISRIRLEPVPEEELNRAKDFMVGQLRMRLESTSEYMSFLGGQLASRQKIETLEEMVSKIYAVTPEEIKAVANQLFVSKNLNLALIGPKISQEGIVIKEIIG